MLTVFIDLTQCRLLFFRHIPLSATLYKILVMDFHTWWRYHYFCFTGTAQQSTLSTYFVFGELSDDCWAVPVKQLGWQWPLVSSSTTKICKSKILRKKCSLLQVPLGHGTPYAAIVVNNMIIIINSFSRHIKAQEKFPGKNRIRKIREKSRYEISYICGQILRLDSIIYCFIEKLWSFFVIFKNFVIFDINIFRAICMNSL